MRVDWVQNEIMRAAKFKLPKERKMPFPPPDELRGLDG